MHYTTIRVGFGMQIAKTSIYPATITDLYFSLHCVITIQSSTNVTDRQTDGQTDVMPAYGMPRLSVALQ